MTRVQIVVEGPTERSFIDKVLAPALWPRQIYVIPIIIGVPGHKGGNVNYARVKKDVLDLLKKDRIAYCSTMFDFYGLDKGFPIPPLPPNLPNIEKVRRTELAIKEDIITQAPQVRGEVRFLPYLQMHEFEGLLFSDPTAFAAGIGQPGLAGQFQNIRGEFTTPEDINDGSTSAPSKRVMAVYPSYRKVLDGTLGAQAVGIEKMRQECVHFREWVELLEVLGANN